MANRSVLAAGRVACLLFLCSVGTACSLRTGTFELSPAPYVKNPRVYPWHICVVTGKEFTPYKITFRYWSSTNLTWSLDGLPDAFVKTLNPHFVAVESVENGRSACAAPYELIARMSIDNLHFDGANTTVSRDAVDLTMRFSLQQPNGTEVFRAIISTRASSQYRQRCQFCKPDPPAAFTAVFKAVFAQLSKLLAESDIGFESASASTPLFSKLAAREFLSCEQQFDCDQSRLNR